ncbi:unnamed protein product [Chrysoparadoxa australica]
MDAALGDPGVCGDLALALQKTHDEGPCAGRALTDSEVSALKANGNWCAKDDWSIVRVKGEGPYPTCRIRLSCFQGPVLLGDLSGSVCIPGSSDRVDSGVYSSTLSDCVVCDDALVQSCQHVVRCHIGPSAALIGCSFIGLSRLACENKAFKTADGSTRMLKNLTYANGTIVSVGPENGGREVPIYAGMTLSDAISQAMCRECTSASNCGGGEAAKGKGRCKRVDEYETRVQEFACKLASHAWGVVIGDCSSVVNSRVTDAFLQPFSTVLDSELTNVTLMSSEVEPSRIVGQCQVANSIIDHGVSVSGKSTVEGSLLCEHSSIGMHAKVTSSVIGPDSSVSTGECHHSLVGPFVGFHHQSLLIAAIWPLGRGNVAYGANIGSNHTSRLADQEIWPGEGVFFGLSCCIKYPTNLCDAPYSVIASGVTCLPQTVAFPFALISSPLSSSAAASVPPAFNLLSPGWVLKHSLFSVLRNAAKYAERAAATHSRTDWPVFRPSTVRLMVNARSALRIAEAVEVADTKGAAIYTCKGCRGLGKNFMTEQGRLEGIEAYTLHIRRYLLTWLLEELEQGRSLASKHEGQDLVLGYGARAAEECRYSWAKEKAYAEEKQLCLELLDSEFGVSRDMLSKCCLAEEVDTGGTSLAELLAELCRIENAVAAAVRHSKAKDDIRGASIIPDYPTVHRAADEEPVVIRAKKEAAEVHARVEKLKAKFPGSRNQV